MPAFISVSTLADSVASHELGNQWSNPSDVFSILLIIGGDVVLRALAQSTGLTVGLPSFSFGWVAYSVNALSAAVGEYRMMPRPDYDCLVINGKTGYARSNKSWVIGRIMRDYDNWMPDESRIKAEKNIDKKWAKQKKAAAKNGEPEPERPVQAGLCISIFRPSDNVTSGVFADHALVATSILVAVLQLGVAAVPCGLSGDWSILMITASGVLLSCLTASLTQWKQEKWACRRQSAGTIKDVILTSGNGSQHAVAILGSEGFLDLEDLASARISTSPSRLVRSFVAVLALLWILLLITAAGLEANTWFLLAVGGIGILFNLYVAAKQQGPRSSGIPLDFVEALGDETVMQSLYQVETSYPRLGSSFLATYFPGEINDDEKVIWADFKNKAKAARHIRATQLSSNIVEAKASV